MKSIHGLLLLLLVFAGCAPARIVDSSWVQYDEAGLTLADLSTGNIALMPIQASSAWESSTPPFAHEFSLAFDQTYPDITYIRWETAVEPGDEARVAELFAASLDFQQRTGIPDAWATRQIGSAVGARYLLVVLIEGRKLGVNSCELCTRPHPLPPLVDPPAEAPPDTLDHLQPDDRYLVVKGPPRHTCGPMMQHDPEVRSFLTAQAQIWDTQDGAIVWEGVGASELHGREGYFAVSDFARSAAQGLVRILPGTEQLPTELANGTDSP